jgi:hypothetical protein
MAARKLWSWGIGNYRQRHFICHTGGILGFSSFFCRFPDEDVTLIILSNREGFDAARLARKMSSLVLDLPAPAHTPISLSPEMAREVTGTYTSVHGSVEVREEKQTLYFCRATSHALAPVSETRFYQVDDEDIEVSFEKKNDQGLYTRLRVVQPFFWFTAERSG